MLASLAAACAAPFQVFLAAYVVLGPLHYLTEIAWLRERGFFTTERRDPAVLAGLGALAASPAVFSSSSMYGAWAMTIGVLAAVGLALRRAPGGAAACAAFVAAIGLIGAHHPDDALVVAALTATIVHVYAFTGLFLLSGALKDRRPTARLALAAFVACAAACFLVANPGLPVGPRFAAALGTGRFEFVQGALYGLLYRARLNHGALFTDPRSVALARFTAFAYLYHYLNWFSKTAVIRWHEVGARSLGLSVAGWGAALVLYAWNYAAGVAALSMLSMLHVTLELPLDALTAAGVARAVLGRTSARAAAVGAGAADRAG
jgi:hypothetical protein